MKFPAGFDPLAVKEWALNGCHFDAAGLDRADARMTELFPNAKGQVYNVDENSGLCILRLEPRQLPPEQFEKFQRKLEDHIRPRRAPDPDESWKPGSNPDSWRG